MPENMFYFEFSCFLKSARTLSKIVSCETEKDTDTLKNLSF